MPAVHKIAEIRRVRKALDVDGVRIVVNLRMRYKPKPSGALKTEAKAADPGT